VCIQDSSGKLRVEPGEEALYGDADRPEVLADSSNCDQQRPL